MKQQENGTAVKLLIFRTNIKSKKKVKALQPLFNRYDPISRWTVDTEDIDNVLRIEAEGHVEEHDVIRMVNAWGYHCEPLED